jgi:hypothetical protein
MGRKSGGGNRMRRTAFTLSILFGFLVVGCGSEPNRPWAGNALMPPPHYDIQLDVELSSSDGAPGRPITVTAMARNQGNRRVESIAIYSCGPEIELQVLGPGGQPVFLKNPCEPVPICLRDGPLYLEPGHFFQIPLSFTGLTYFATNWPTECATDQAASGDYVVVARFRYSVEKGSLQVLEKRVPFHWSEQ